MRKIYTALLALLGLSLATPALAQLEELEHKTITIGQDCAESVTPDTQWYLIYNHLENKYPGGGFIWDCGLLSDVYLSNGRDVVEDGMLATYAAEYMVRFVSTDESYGDIHDKYYLQFGTGNYIDFGTQYHVAATSQASIDKASLMYVYLALDTPGYFCFSTTDGSNYRADTYGTGREVILSGQGEKDDLSYLDDVWFLFPITFNEVSGREETLLELTEVFKKYREYRGTFTVGTSPGCYDADAVEAFETALDNAGSVIDSGSDALENLTEEEINQLAQDIIDAYEAVTASMVSRQLEIEDGYYFIPCGLTFYVTNHDIDPETGETIEVTTYYTKAMYSELESDGTIYARWNTIERTAPYLWKITGKGNREYEVVNMATNATFNNVAKSTNVTMTKGGENLMCFDINLNSNTLNGAACIRVSTQAIDNYYYLHCDSHRSGAGTSGAIVGWSNDEAPTIWDLERVSDEEAQAIMNEYSSNKNALAVEMITDADEKMAIAEDIVPLITSVSQLSSPYTDASEGSLANLLDDDSSTYWHSDWHGGKVPYGTHYLQVEVAEGYDELMFKFTRRKANENHITEWGVYGAPYADADKIECEQLAEIETPYGNNTETLTSDPFPTLGYTILRFYIDGTTGNDQNGYGHMSEFQLYEYTGDKLTQKAVMGDIYTNLEEAIEVAKEELADGDISEEAYNALKESYDAFIAVFVDPTELRAALSQASSAVKGAVIGTNPGEWSDSGTADALATTVTEVSDYDAASVYTQSQTDSYLATLERQMEAFADAAIKVQTGKWYELRYATEDEIEENGWNPANGAATDTSNELYGKYVAAANLIDEDGIYTIDPLMDIDDVCVGQNLYFEEKIDIMYEDCAKFRFISVGDTAYIMQNKATGLFLKATDTNDAVTLSVHPTLFNVSAIGYGENLLSGVTLAGESQDNLYAQLEQNVLVTSSANTAGTNCGLYIEDISEDVAGDYDGTSFNLNILQGSINMFCFPVSVTANDGTMYGVTVDGSVVTLAQMEGNKANAGQPFVYINGGLDDYDAEYEEEPVPFTHGYDLAKEAQTSGELVGSYYGETVGTGKLIASGNTFVVSRSSSTVAANSAYINGSFDADATIDITISDENYDGVESAVAAVAQEGSIYSIDGKLLGRGNLNTVKSFGKGVYIVNGVKVAVK